MVWGTSLTILSWFIYAHTMMVPGYVDRAGRFKGTDFIYFYVMGSLMADGRADALYDADAHLAEGRRRIDPALNLYAPYSNYGPQVAAAFVPFSKVPFGRSLALFLLLTAAAYAVSIWCVARACPGLAGYGPAVVILAAGSPAFFSLLRYAQLSAASLLLLSLAVAAHARNRRFAAGLMLGTLVFKPQLGLVAGVVMLAAGEWRIVSGCVVAAGAQLAAAWLAGGTDVMRQYLRMLWTLARHPSLVQIYPGEVHSLRGFTQLLVASPAAVSAVSLLALGGAVWIGVRTWKSELPLPAKWGQLIVLTILASPHLLTYDLVLLTIPLLAFASWALANRAHPLQPRIGRLLLLLYLAPFSSNLVRLAPIQVSVVVVLLLVWTVLAVGRSSPVTARRLVRRSAGPLVR